LATIDFFQTAMALAGEKNSAGASKLPLDGKNALAFLLGQEKKPLENLYLFFDKEYLRTARAGKSKIHIARWNIPRYTAASGQQKNLRLPKPELYDMTLDPSESYNVADRFPEVVKQLQSRIATSLMSFPEEIRLANAELINPVANTG